MPKLKDEQKESDIRQAAMKLVLQTGFNSLKMADVAKEANIATGTLYVYYKSKEELINAVYARTKKEMITVLLDPSHATSNFYTTFKNMWTAYFDYCLSNVEKMIFVEQFVYSGLITDQTIHETEEGLTPLNQFLEYGQQNRILKKMDLSLVKAQMQGATHETIKVMTKLKQVLPPSEIDKCFSITWDGLKSR